jgi:hypothetical protein
MNKKKKTYVLHFKKSDKEKERRINGGKEKKKEFISDQKIFWFSLNHSRPSLGLKLKNSLGVGNGVRYVSSCILLKRNIPACFIT